MRRNEFILSSLAAMFPPAAPVLMTGHRQASLRQAGPDVFQAARVIPGLSGIELQVQYQGQSLWDRETLLTYKRAAAKARLSIPSLAGIWEKGMALVQPKAVEEAIPKSIRSAEALGARVILVAAFRERCPSMDNEASYGPVVAALQRVGPMAADAGVTLGLETSLSPEDDRKLVDLVNHRGVKIYFDAFNTEYYGHKGGSVTGIHVLGKDRICQVHCKNEAKLLEEPGPVDWPAALKALREIGYKGWYVFETRHSGMDQAVESTKRNIEFLRRHTA